MTDQLNPSQRATEAATDLFSLYEGDGLELDQREWNQMVLAFARFEQGTADRVRELEAENTRLRAAVERFVADYDDNDRADAGCSALMEMHVRDFRAALTTAPTAPVNRLRRILKGWADWYRLATADDDNEYLNGKGWDDAEALEDMTLAALWDQSTSQENLK